MRLRFFVLAFFASAFSANAQTQSPAALAGLVSSAEEGAMEGVLVSAKKAGSNITITVVSDKQGRYGFPAGKLALGMYSLKVRAVGYELEGFSELNFTGRPLTKNLRLKKATDLASQLSNGEWMTSAPFVDNSTTPVTFWVGSNHGASIVKLEPLD